MRGNDRFALVALVLLGLAVLACNTPETPTTGAQPTAFIAPTFTVPPTDPPTEPPSPEPTSGPPPTVAQMTVTPSQSAPPPPQPTTGPVNPSTGALVDFENWGSWRRGDQANGTFEQSTERVYDGQYAGKLSYDFPTSGNDFVVFVHPVLVSGTPDRLYAWVYGDGEGHFLNLWIRDAEEEVWQATFGQVDHTGWQRMMAEIGVGQDWPWGHISGPDNGVVDYPIEFYALALDDGGDSFSGSGVIFVDEVETP